MRRYPSFMARLEGLEPPTHCLEGSCSIHLSYKRIYIGAGDGNRTHVTSLEGWNSTIELHLHLGDGVYFNIYTVVRQAFFAYKVIL